MMQPDFQEDAKWISSRLRPRVTVPRVKKALAQLERVGLIQRNAEGKAKKYQHRKLKQSCATTGKGRKNIGDQ